MGHQGNNLEAKNGMVPNKLAAGVVSQGNIRKYQLGHYLPGNEPVAWHSRAFQRRSGSPPR
jgi:hypothetical protein